MSWRYYNPVQIEFGAGAFDQVEQSINGRSFGIVTYADAFCSSLIERLTTRAGTPAIIIDDVAANPDYRLLGEQTKRIADEASPDVWVALGGGSVIDTAKVLAAADGDFETVTDFLETGSGGDRLSSAPIIAIPTTAGTGSEVTYWATVWNEVAGKKYSLARPNLYPECALVDPELTCTKSLGLTVTTGLDALSHSLESLWNVNANPISAHYAVFAAREIIDVLPKLADDLGNLQLRSRMARAATIAGLAFSNTKTAIAHSMSYPVTLRHNVPHGVACSFSLPNVIRSVDGVGGLCEQALTEIFACGMDSAASKVTTLLETLGVSTDPSAYGINDAEWRQIINDAFDGERGKNFIIGRDRFIEAAAGRD